MLEMLNRVEQAEQRVDSAETRINAKSDELVVLVNSAVEMITLNPTEENEFKSVVGKKSHELAKNYFDGSYVNQDLFLAKVGQIRSAIYRHTKLQFDVSIYRLIKRVDFNDAKAFANGLSLSSFEPYEIRQTARQKELAGE